MQQGLSVNDALKKLEHYCAYQDRCYKEVTAKLKSLGMYQDAIDYILNELSTNKFLNEERFAKSFARGKHKIKGWGKRRIEQELKYRDISSYNIKTALKEIEEDYITNFYDLAEKKWMNSTETSIELKKKKWIDYFMRKGYESHLIFQALKDIE